jgi:serine-type D-Ala-D-Ala carboxypeptidase/endopeptidase (penicillin-binding protein 4)
MIIANQKLRLGNPRTFRLRTANKIHLKISVWFLVFGVFVSAVSAQSTNEVPTLSALQSKLRAHVTQKKFDAGMWGIKVISLDTEKTLFEHNANKLFSPASNSKLYTAALGLHRLGQDHRIKTSLYSTERPKRGTLKGDLIVYGRGDPTINARLYDKDIFKALQPLVHAVTNAGIKRINGNLVGDESYFRQAPYGSGWDCHDLQYYYGAEISALTINDNYMQLIAKPSSKVGEPCALSLSPPTKYVKLVNQTQTGDKGSRHGISFYRPLGQNVVYVYGQWPIGETNFVDDVTMHNPAGLFVTLLKEALQKNGVKVSGKARTMNWIHRQSKPLDLASVVELGSVESLPLRDILREIQKPSQNLYTDLLLSHVAEQLRSPDDQRTGSEDLGIRELNKFLGEIGIGRGETIFEEGSGLSRNNLTTPNATVKLMTFMNKHKAADVYRDALPIAGVDGTLRNRMKNTAAAGNVRAKTGTLRWANSISGFVKSASGEHLVFSVMLNRYNNTDDRRSSRQELDDVAVMLANFRGRSDASE